ncbi:E3 ubiquitin-protein ligase RING1 [Artemisia annua]|uniref:RING-type E3 ubiquitin transferase n=1 Tax=Artemisia annua TaxID=35608 RepID=A0A2U1MZD3_ARTAN|nr:E3 ubiquitin-protein ligase RING1 [Artemisia annua]
MSEFLLGSGFDRFLDQLTQIEVNGLGLGLGVTDGNPPASKDAVAKMPNVVIEEKHVLTDDPHCAVCKDAFVLGTEVKEMPCQHLYHSECILPWLALRNSCPVCRHELPSDSRELDGGQVGGNGDEAVGLTIWRLPGGGFAVGRFAGGRRGIVVALKYSHSLPSRWDIIEVIPQQHELNTAWLCGGHGHPILNVGDLSVEASGCEKLDIKGRGMSKLRSRVEYLQTWFGLDKGTQGRARSHGYLFFD